MNKNNAKKPRFSIVIPTYSADLLLMDCIDSLCKQPVDKSELEVIVINDGGKREIHDLLYFKKTELTIKYFYQENKGPAAARNLGILHAKGDIILFLDDDSLPTENWLKAVIRAWEKFSNFDCIGGYTICDTKDNIYCKVNSDFLNWYLDQYSNDTLHPFLVTCNAGYRKTILNKIGNFDERFKNASGEDRDLNIKISKIGGKLRLDKNILIYHDKDLTFHSFIIKHFNYGEAAHQIYIRYPELKHLSTNSYFDLYISIIKKYRTFKQKLIVFLLLTLSQACTIIGYSSAIFSKKNGYV